MKSLSIALCVTALLTAVVAADSTSAKSFATMKSLQGSWEGKNSTGQPVSVVYRLTAGDSTLLSEIEGQSKHGQEDMISMIHLDKDRLLLTHYCSAGNQPRMQASLSPDGKSVTFDFIDGTNIPTADSGHMSRVVITMLDPNHHTEEWIFADHGKELKEVFDLKRKN